MKHMIFTAVMILAVSFPYMVDRMNCTSNNDSLLTKNVQPFKKEEAQKNNRKKERVSKKDIKNLARLIYAENGSHKDDEALLLTGVVVLKRVKSDEYPDTIMGVISQNGQYATWIDGTFYCTPDKRSIKIAKKLLKTNIADKYPDNLVFQAEFKQGKKVYKSWDMSIFAWRKQRKEMTKCIFHNLCAA